MGRSLKRVALDFNHPMNTVWPGFVAPSPSRRHRRICSHCGRTGESDLARRISSQWYGHVPLDPADAARAKWSPMDPYIRALIAQKIAREPGYYGKGPEAVTREAVRMCNIYNAQLSHNISQADVDALAPTGAFSEIKHTFVAGTGWVPRAEGPFTADEVNRWSLTGQGFLMGNYQWELITVRCKRAGVTALCPHCGGKGEHWVSARVRARFQKYKPVQPPAGPGYQLWETVTEGSPISPVFAQPEQLAHWLQANPHGIDEGTTFEQWMRFIKGPGWAPSSAGSGGALKAGVKAMTD